MQIRTFLAIDMSPAVRRAAGDLIQVISQLRARVSWVSPANLHVTLKFLGEVEQDSIAEICAAISSAIDQSSIPIQLELRGLGAFPSNERPRTIWIGASVTNDRLAHMHQNIDRALCEVGCRPESRPFRPHLTIGRVRGGRHLREVTDMLARHSEFDAGVCRVDEFVLMSSERSKSGSTYMPLARFPV